MLPSPEIDGLHGKERLVPALAHLRRGAHVDDGLVDASGRRALGCIDADHLVQADARLVIRELQRVAQQQVEQCSRRLPSDEVILRVQTLERRGGGVDQPLDVVGSGRGVGPDPLQFRERAVVHHAALEQLWRGREHVIEDPRRTGASEAEVDEQVQGILALRDLEDCSCSGLQIPAGSTG